jgi:hypothetical protein
MLARRKSSKKGTLLPPDWTESLNRLLNETYKTECKLKEKYFDVYGQAFSEELLVVVSYLSEQDESLTPLTLFLSSGPTQIEDVSKIKETQKNYIELVGLFFDEIFADTEWNNFEPNWQEVTHGEQTYFFKISRENINSTIEANKLLGEDFEDIEFDDDNDHDQ